MYSSVYWKLQEKLAVPTLHIAGACRAARAARLPALTRDACAAAGKHDEIIGMKYSRAVCDRFVEPQWMEFEGSHVVPQRGGDVRIVLEFVQKHVQDAPATDA